MTLSHKNLNVFLSSSEDHVGVGTILHFVKCGNNLTISYDSHDENGSYKLVDHDDGGKVWYGFDILVTDGPFFNHHVDRNQWIEHDSVEPVDIGLPVAMPRGSQKLQDLMAARKALVKYNSPQELVDKVDRAIADCKREEGL